MSDPVDVVAYDPAWPRRFAELGTGLRAALGEVAARIDHIGSTAVPGLVAKPVIDVQVSVLRFEPLSEYAEPLRRLGFGHRADNPELTKRYFRELSGPRTHVHVRVLGSSSQRVPLLFRDYLRTHDDDAERYGALKRALAHRFRNDRTGYVEAKDPEIRAILRLADRWARETGWTAGPSDA